MLSFPQIADLPRVVDTTGWRWEPFTEPFLSSDDFWLGTDTKGNRWLTKLRGDFRAYREIVFGRLVQNMGWSCQSTVFMRLDASSANLLKKKPGSVHAAHWFLDEHLHQQCGDNCGLAPIIGKAVGSVEDLSAFSISHLMDWPRSEMAACLFGGNEPPGHLFTATHEFVIIDAELMFSTEPCSPDCTAWWGNRDDPHLSALNLAQEVCDQFLSLGHVGLQKALDIPHEISIIEQWPIAPILFASYSYAERLQAMLHRALTKSPVI